MRAEQLADRIWYRRHPAAFLLWPLSLLFGLLAGLRRQAYRQGWLACARLPVPLIVVGNISVGGVGKTPVVIALVQALAEAGYRPGVVSRGYGRAGRDALLLDDGTAVAHSGDEPALIRARCACPVAVGADRPRAARLLLEAGVDVIVSDDGLQHYAMARDIEIAVVDGRRGVGNGFLLPAGPLREPPARLQNVDLVLVNGDGTAVAGERLRPALGAAQPLRGGEAVPLDAFAGRPLHAVTGIGDPERFFDALRAQGLDIRAHAFADHHRFVPADLDFGDDAPLLMTEKDAVKCRAFAPPQSWAVPLQLTLPAAAVARVLERLRAIRSGE